MPSSRRSPRTLHESRARPRIAPPHLQRPRCRSLMGLRIIGTGSYVPDSWLPTTTCTPGSGSIPMDRQADRILERPDTPCPTRPPAICASKPPSGASPARRIDPKDIDLIVLGTFTPDMSFPSTACLVQDRMG